MIAGVGINTLSGGGGSDTFTVNDTGDVVVEGAGGGTDLVRSLANAYTLSNPDVENLSFIGVGNFIGTGNASANVINGGTGADTLTGGDGNDTVNGGTGADTINWSFAGPPDGADTVDGGADADTLNITGSGGGNSLDVIFNGSALTAFELGTVVNVEAVTANLRGGTDTLNYGTTTAAVTVNLGAGTASGFSSIISVENATGGSGADTLTGSTGANTLIGNAGADTLSGGGGVDILNGGRAADTLTGGDGADVIDTGAANDNLADRVQISATTEFGDLVSNFDASGSATQVDRVEFGGALNTAYDDIGANDDNFVFALGNGAAGALTVNLNTTIEALLLTGAAGEGVTNPNLGNAALVSAAFNTEFDMTADAGQDALLVVNDTDSNGFALWQWVQLAAAVGA